MKKFRNLPGIGIKGGVSYDIKLNEIDPFTCWNAVTPACLIAAEALLVLLKETSWPKTRLSDKDLITIFNRKWYPSRSISTYVLYSLIYDFCGFLLPTIFPSLASGNVSFGSSFATVFVGNKKMLEAVDADPTAFAKFTTFQGQYPHDTTVAVVVNGNLMRLWEIKNGGRMFETCFEFMMLCRVWNLL